MTELEFAMMYLGEYAVKGAEIVPRYCPYCNGGEHHDKNTFALNMEKHTFNCRRGSCGRQGHFSQLCKDFGVEPEVGPYAPKVKRSYKKPETKPQEADGEAMAYLKLRGITKETAAAYGIGQDKSGNMVFPYYRSKDDFEKRSPTFVKFRKPRKIKKGERKMWREADTEPILFGMHYCETFEKLYIFEGEFDAMCGYQASGENCVSVPSGCEDYTWLETCGEWIAQFETVIIMADNDDAGIKMLRELSIKLDNRVMQPDLEMYRECKDANEILVRHGAEQLLAAMQSARIVETKGLLNLAEIPIIDISELPRTLSGIQQLDSATGGMLMGDLSVWTGKRGSGKSMMLTQLLLEAVDQGSSVCAYSGEIPADRFRYNVNLQAAGDAYAKEREDVLARRIVQYVCREDLKKIENWYNGKFWLYDNRIADKDEVESVLRLFEIAYKRYDCRVFLVDNLMTVSTCRNDADYYQMQADFTIQLRKLAEKLGAHIHLVVHPRKGGIKDADDVGGLSTITNIACNVFSMRRATEEEIELGYNAVLSCLKNRAYGENTSVQLQYSTRSRRYTECNMVQKQYGWIEKPKEYVQREFTDYDGNTPFEEGEIEY